MKQFSKQMLIYFILILFGIFKFIQNMLEYNIPSVFNPNHKPGDNFGELLSIIFWIIFTVLLVLPFKKLYNSASTI